MPVLDVFVGFVNHLPVLYCSIHTFRRNDHVANVTQKVIIGSKKVVQISSQYISPEQLNTEVKSP